MELSLNPVRRFIIKTGEDERIFGFFILAGVLIILLDILTGFQGMQWSGADLWHHRAVLLALSENPLDPLNPHIASNEGSRSFTPIFVILGYFASLFSFSADAALGISSIINLLLLFLGAYFFCRALGSKNTIFFLFIILYTWLRTPNFSGFHNLRSIAGTNAFPSAHSFALTLMIWGIFIETISLQGSQIVRWLILTLLLSVNILTHQFTAFFCMGGLSVFTLLASEHQLKIIIKTAALIFLAMGIGLLWPYYDLISILTSVSNKGWGEIKWFYDPLTVIRISLPALMAIILLTDLHRIRVIRVMAVCAAGLFSVYLITYFIGIAAGHRLLPFWIFFLQIIIFLAFQKETALPTMTPMIKDIRPYFLFSIIVLAFIQCTLSVVDIYRSNIEKTFDITFGKKKTVRYYDAAKSLSMDIDKTSIVIAKHNAAFPIQGFGVRVVSIPRLAPMIADLEERETASDNFFAQGISCQERLAVARKFNATHAGFINGDLDEKILVDIMALGKAKTYQDLISVVKLPAECPSIKTL